MKHTLRFACLAGLSLVLCACGKDAFLYQNGESCNKYPTPDARTACEAKYKEGAAAYAKEFESDKATGKAKGGATEAATPKKDSLCFKRATGEVVCPN